MRNRIVIEQARMRLKHDLLKRDLASGKVHIDILEVTGKEVSCRHNHREKDRWQADRMVHWISLKILLQRLLFLVQDRLGCQSNLSSSLSNGSIRCSGELLIFFDLRQIVSLRLTYLIGYHKISAQFLQAWERDIRVVTLSTESNKPRLKDPNSGLYGSMRRRWKEDPVNIFWVVLLTLNQELQCMLGQIPLSPDIEVACFAMARSWELHGIIGGLYAPLFGPDYD